MRLDFPRRLSSFADGVAKDARQNSLLIFKMSTNRGIFESFPNPPGTRQDSPFAVVHEPEAAAASPFAAARQDSPFTVVEDGTAASSGEFGRPVKLPERRKVDSPFQVAEPTEGFGFEAPARAMAASPFETAAAPAPAASPFSAPPQAVPASPFAVAETPQAAPASPFSVAETPRPAATQAAQAAIAAFAQWPEPTIAAPAPPAPAPFAAPAHVPAAFAAAPEPAPFVQAPAPVVQAAAPVVQAPAPAQPFDDSQSDSFNIRQLELRAIFGVDREMNADEILQRSRALPGMRNIARVATAEMATIDSLKTLLPNLGFGTGALKLYAGSVPLEFIREGSVMLAVQTDGGYAPGVRETLMIVARELSRLGMINMEKGF